MNFRRSPTRSRLDSESVLTPSALTHSTLGASPMPYLPKPEAEQLFPLFVGESLDGVTATVFAANGRPLETFMGRSTAETFKKLWTENPKHIDYLEWRSPVECPICRQATSAHDDQCPRNPDNAPVPFDGRML